MAAQANVCDFGAPAPVFSLLATDGRTYGLADVAGEHGLLLIFMCNHCPYVKSILDRLVDTAAQLQAMGIGVAGICANDAVSYPEDSFDKMRALAEQKAFGFPYLWDESQAVAKAYGAVCTPDFFGYNAELGLQYRGRLDASRTQLIPDAEPELLNAMTQIAATGQGPADQIPSMGCSIKWR